MHSQEEDPEDDSYDEDEDDVEEFNVMPRKGLTFADTLSEEDDLIQIDGSLDVADDPALLVRMKSRPAFLLCLYFETMRGTPPPPPPPNTHTHTQNPPNTHTQNPPKQPHQRRTRTHTHTHTPYFAPTRASVLLLSNTANLSQLPKVLLPFFVVGLCCRRSSFPL